VVVSKRWIRLATAWTVISFSLVGSLFLILSAMVAYSINATYFPDQPPISIRDIVAMVATFALPVAGFVLGIWLIKTTPPKVSSLKAEQKDD
jgi:hypothetical protein